MNAEQPTNKGLTSEGTLPEPGLARNLSELARRLNQDADLQGVLDRTVWAAVDELDLASCAGIMLVGGLGMRTVASTESRIERLHEIQHTSGQGPCLQSADLHETVVSNDLERETRWPVFCHEALRLGIRSVLSLELFAGGREYGALNVYSEHRDAFDMAAESVGLLLASHAALAMVATDTEHGLRQALNHRDLIGQAKGVLMERYKITGEQAFDLLVTSSQHCNRKLRDIAVEVATTGEFTPPSGFSASTRRPEI